MRSGDQLRLSEVSEPESGGMGAATAQTSFSSPESTSGAGSAQLSSSSSEGTSGAGTAQLSHGDADVVGVVVIDVVGAGSAQLSIECMLVVVVVSVEISVEQASVEASGLASADGVSRV